MAAGDYNIEGILRRWRQKERNKSKTGRAKWKLITTEKQGVVSDRREQGLQKYGS